MYKYIQLLYMLCYTKSSQLCWRAWYLLKRWWLSGRTQYGIKLNKKLAPSRSIVAIPQIAAAHQAQSLLVGKTFQFAFLNQPVSYSRPINFYQEIAVKDKHLWLFHLHYMEYLDHVDDMVFMELVNAWIDQNKPYSPKYWLAGWSSYCLSLRVVVWMQQFSKRTFPDDFSKKFLNSIFQQLLFLTRNLEKDILGNHYIKNLKALILGGVFFQGEQAVRFYRQGFQRLWLALKDQILSDGMHYERSPSYHCQVFEDLLIIYHVAEKEEKNKLKPILDKMAKVLINMTHPDGYISLFGDGGKNMANLPKDLLAYYHCEIPTEKAFVYPQAGYFGYRNNDVYFLADFGKLAPDELPGHGHGDIGSFELALYGQDVFVDQGTLQYEWGEARRRSKASACHNTLTLNNRDQAEFFGAFRMGFRPRKVYGGLNENEASYVIYGSHDGYRRFRGAPRHERKFTINSGSLTIEDTVLGGQGQKAAIGFLLSPHLSVETQNDKLLIEGLNFSIVLQAPGRAKVEEAVYWPDFGVEKQTKRIVIEVGEAPCRHVTQINWWIKK